MDNTKESGKVALKTIRALLEYAKEYDVTAMTYEGFSFERIVTEYNVSVENQVERQVKGSEEIDPIEEIQAWSINRPSFASDPEE